jgi:outer membrane lipoprotein-sorting protein
MRIAIILLLSILTFQAQAQKDPNAKAILDKVGVKVKASKGILVKIQLVSKNNKGKALGTKLIQLKMKGEKYLLNEGKLEILCDGVSIYNFDGLNTISKSSLAETEQTLSPQKLLSGNYDKDFNFNLLAQNSNTATIELFPIDRKKGFQKVTLIIDKVKSALSNAIILDKSNNITDVKVLSINYAASFEDKLFVFNRAKYPKNVEIFD